MTSAYSQYRNVMISVADEEDPTKEEWNAYAAAALRANLETRARGERLRFLVLTDGSAPNAAQRAMMTDGVPSDGVKVAVLTSSVFARSVGTVFGWFSINIKVFAPLEAREACAFLEIPPAMLEGLWAEVRRVAARVPRLRTLTAAERALR